MDVTLSLRDALYVSTLLIGFGGNAYLLWATVKKVEKIYKVLFGNGEAGMDEHLRTIEAEQHVIHTRLDALPCLMSHAPRRLSDSPERPPGEGRRGGLCGNEL